MILFVIQDFSTTLTMALLVVLFSYLVRLHMLKRIERPRHMPGQRRITVAKAGRANGGLAPQSGSCPGQQEHPAGKYVSVCVVIHPRPNLEFPKIKRQIQFAVDCAEQRFNAIFFADHTSDSNSVGFEF
jgi:hypothetical protein